MSESCINFGTAQYLAFQKLKPAGMFMNIIISDQRSSISKAGIYQMLSFRDRLQMSLGVHVFNIFLSLLCQYEF